jgi:hypothetical protein
MTFTLTVASPGFPSVSASLSVEVVGVDRTSIGPIAAGGGGTRIVCQQESGAAFGIFPGSGPGTLPFSWTAWAGTYDLSGWDSNLVVTGLERGVSTNPDLLFVRKDGRVVFLQRDVRDPNLQFDFGITDMSVNGTWTLFTQLPPGATCSDGGMAMPSGMSPTPMSVIIDVGCRPS